MAITITGRLTKVEAKRIKDPDYLGVGRYSPNSERYLHFLNCCLTTEDGQRYFFDGPKVRQTVTSAPGVAVVLFDVEGEAEKWFEYHGEPGDGVATAQRANSNRIEPRIKVGDIITIRASIKATKPTYMAVNRIKLVEVGQQ